MTSCTNFPVSQGSIIEQKLNHGYFDMQNLLSDPPVILIQWTMISFLIHLEKFLLYLFALMASRIALKIKTNRQNIDQFIYIGNIVYAGGATEFDATGCINSARSAYVVSFKIWICRYICAVIWTQYIETEYYYYSRTPNLVPAVPSVYSGLRKSRTMT